MNLKVGDRVRIKTEEELLADGWIKSYSFWQNTCYNIHERRCGKVFTIKEILDDGIGIIAYCGDYKYGLPILAIAEVIPQTLDEYICSLPLEERATYFIVEYVDPEWACTIYLSAITRDEYRNYEEALQATIEALKQPKE